MSLPLIADTMVASGQQFSLDLQDLRALCVKMCVLSFKYVDRRALWARVFPDAFADWDLVRPNTNTLGDLLMWIPFLELFAWEGLEKHEAAHPPLSNMRKAIRAAGLDVGGHHLLCQLLILHMLQGVPALQAFQLMTCRCLKRDTQGAAALLLAALSDSPQTPESYEVALAVVLGDCLKIDTSQLETHLKAAKYRREGLSAALKQKSITAYSGRPRLRDRATPSEEQKLSMDTTYGTWESYKGFCQLHQFPNVLSENVKARLYFLAAQQTWDWRPHVSAVFRHEGDAADKLRKFPVSKPDLGVLHQVISSLRMDGKAPFRELTEFKNTCFRSFPVSQTHRMTLSEALRLYACAYQPAHCWRDLWKLQISLMSPQISKDCEAFAQRVPFADQAFVSLLCSSVQ
jgi:hypothetical protein